MAQAPQQPKQGASLDMWLRLAIDTLRHPADAARRVLGLNISLGELVQAAVVITSAGMVLAFIAIRISPGAVDEVSAAVLHDPMVGAGLELLVLAVIAFVTFHIGRLFGGTGDLGGALRLVVWLNATLLLIQVAQVLALLVYPPLAVLLAVASVIWALWAFANFVTVLHGFQNSMLVLGGVVLTAIVLFIAIAMLFALLGFTPQETA